MGKAFIKGRWFKTAWPFGKQFPNNWPKIMLDRAGHFIASLN